MGIENRDKRTHVNFVVERIDDRTAADLWAGDDLAARMIETWPNEETRAGWQLTADEDPDARKWIATRWKEIGLREALWTARAYERAYGGAAILLGTKDFNDPSSPLGDNLAGFEWLTVFEPEECKPETYYTDIKSPKFGTPLHYRINPSFNGTAGKGQPGTPESNILVHESRIIPFEGIRVSRRRVAGNSWGESILTRAYSVLRDYNAAWGSTGVLLQDFAQATFAMKGLAELLANDPDATIEERLKAVVLARSTIGAVLIDSEEKFGREATPVAGLAELLRALAERLAAAAEIPLTFLLGISPGGLNATGESDHKIFDNRIRASQEKNLLPAIERVTELLFAADGREPPEDWGIEFNSLTQQSEKAEAETRKLDAETAAIDITNGVVTPDESAKSRYGGAKYSRDVVIDFDERARLEEMEPDPEPTPVDPEADPDPESEDPEAEGDPDPDPEVDPEDDE